MKRREVLGVIGGAAAWPLAVWAQQPKNVPRIGFLATGSIESAEMRASLEAFDQGLREYGYIDGQNVLVEVRAADLKVERFPALTSEPVVLTSISSSHRIRPPRVPKSKRPPLFPLSCRLWAILSETGSLLASLDRGNITGLTFLGPQLVPKRLALLKEALPTTSQVAALWHPGAYGERTMNDMMNEAQEAALTLGVHLRLVAVHAPDDLDRAFSTVAGERADALLVFPSPMLFNQRKRIVDLAAEHRLPIMAMGKEFVQLGGFMSYGADIIDFNRRCVAYVDKILKGAKPADLPVEQPTKFELFINLKTAKTLGIEIPPSLVARADEVIE
jgi:putative ABC transport system substrate-binding protein